MCGIAGFTGEDQEKIERMTRALAHRGPDGNRSITTRGASIGHARLAILDPSPRGDQPMWNDEKSIVIVHNGEIFNFRELRKQEKLDCKTGTDTEVLLKLYEKYGMSFVEKLRGMFAFAIYDTKKRTWHLARDPSGIKPLFVSVPQKKLHFASEMRSLMTALPKKPELNLTALSQYVQLQYVPGQDTLCEGISSLPPGTVLSWNEEAEEKRENIQPIVQKPLYESKRDFQSTFPSLMDDVVKEHLISDRPIGIFLSGGMDSSILLHHMSTHASKPIQTFTVRFDATEEEGEKRFNTDADLAKLTAKHYQTEHHEVLLTAAICRDMYRDTARALDQPNADSVAMAQFLLSREAKKHVDVVLSGSGGDELFGGYPRYRIAKILHALRFIPRSVRCGSAKILGYPSDVLGMSPGPQLAVRLLARPINEIQHIQKGEWFDPIATTKLFEERFASLHQRDPVRDFMNFDRSLWLVDESLRLADGVTMASGLECRVPFLDARVIAASECTQSEWNVRFGRTKALLKEVYLPILPSHLSSLSKACFYPPLAKWLRRECAVLVHETLEHGRIKEFFEVDAVRKVFEEHQSGKCYGLHTLSTLTQLRCWFETVYDTR